MRIQEESGGGFEVNPRNHPISLIFSILSISMWVSSGEIWLYTSMVTDILLFPIMYCSTFGSIPASFPPVQPPFCPAVPYPLVKCLLRHPPAGFPVQPAALFQTLFGMSGYFHAASPDFNHYTRFLSGRQARHLPFARYPQFGQNL